MKNKLKVLVYPSVPNINACDLYRWVVPLNNCEDFEVRVAYKIDLLVDKNKKATADKKDILWADVVLFLRYYPEDKLALIEHLLKACKSNKRPIIYDTDDLLHMVKQNTFDEHEFEKRNKTNDLKTMEMVFAYADHVTVSTQPLKDYYSSYTKAPITVLPNCYDPVIWDNIKLKKQKHKAFRVGWSGGNNHFHRNMQLLVEPLNILKKKYGDKIEFSMMSGFHPNQDWFPEHRNEFKHEIEFFPGVNLDEYPQALADMNLDLGLIVVQDNEFSRAKSHIKWMEYGLCGVPSIASDVEPYKNTTAVLVDNSVKSWVDSIEKMMTNHEYYGIIKQETKRKVKEWNINRHSAKWKELYHNVRNLYSSSD